MSRLMARALFLVLTLFASLAGCTATPRATAGASSGPHSPAAVTVDPWNYRGEPARLLRTAHYEIHTTIPDDDVVMNVAQLMEGAHEQYRLLAPDVPLSDEPMQCYLFKDRPEWAVFTKSRTGADANIYLQIGRGGYTVGDWYVAYFVGDVGTYSVAAHEGFHQFIARHFKTRPPPFLEEGLACLFEEVKWKGKRLPAWDLSQNNGRRNGIRDALANRTMIPLERLVEMHAGMVVDRPHEEVEGFYAQNWAFARFLWDAEDGRYRPALQKLLADAAAGELVADAGLQTGTTSVTWQPKSVKPMLEHYLGMPLADVEAAYLKYARKIAGSAVVTSSYGES
jgi:hypothetical protein